MVTIVGGGNGSQVESGSKKKRFSREHIFCLDTREGVWNTRSSLRNFFRKRESENTFFVVCIFSLCTLGISMLHLLQGLALQGLAMADKASVFLSLQDPGTSLFSDVDAS